MLVMVGCASGGKGSSPIEIPISENTGLTSQGTEYPGLGRMLLGLWDVALNRDSGQFEAVPLRTAGFHVNVVSFIQSPEFLGIEMLYENYTTGEFHLNVTLTHPFPNTDLMGFDVRGIVYGNGAAQYGSKMDPDLLWLGPSGFRLLNEDGWTRWWNPTEFTTSGLFGYTEGVFGTKGFNFPATLNPYKYFANALNATDPVVPNVNSTNRGSFATNMGSVTRRYELKFPIVG